LLPPKDEKKKLKGLQLYPDMEVDMPCFPALDGEPGKADLLVAVGVAVAPGLISVKRCSPPIISLRTVLPPSVAAAIDAPPRVELEYPPPTRVVSVSSSSLPLTRCEAQGFVMKEDVVPPSAVW
jgi:hypothetical protein